MMRNTNIESDEQQQPGAGPIKLYGRKALIDLAERGIDLVNSWQHYIDLHNCDLILPLNSLKPKFNKKFTYIFKLSYEHQCGLSGPIRGRLSSAHCMW